MISGTYKMRAVQLDLARQMESLEFIRQFIDFIAEHSFNTLVLYLEGRIKTKTFPYPLERDSYSIEEMSEIVEYSKTKQIEVVPVVATLAHAEQFLKFPEMACLSEVTDESPGRFGSAVKNTFCTSKDELYVFLDSYIGDLTSVFSSKYFHVGLDECFNMAFCDICRGRINNGEVPEDIFTKHINAVHEILVRHGKRMMMWDDMFEFYPKALECIPNDIILCCWQYDNLVDIPRTHFSSRKRVDSLPLYRNLGFDVVIAPADRMMRNIETFTQYASKTSIFGGIVAGWEKTCLFYWESYPIIAFAGKLWDNTKKLSADTIMTSCIIEIFGISDKLFVNAIKTYCSVSKGGYPNINKIKLLNYLRGPVSEIEFERNRMFLSIRDILNSYSDSVTSSTGQKILEDMLIMLREFLINYQLREHLPQLLAPQSSIEIREQAKKSLGESILEITELKQLRNEQWIAFRKTITPCNTDIYYEKLRTMLLETIKAPIVPLLNVRFMLIDQYSAQKNSFYIKYQNDSDWKLLESGVFKSLEERESCYMISFPVPEGVPEAVKIGSSGYGGQGFLYMEIETQNTTYIPEKVIEKKGQVHFSENILTDDLQWSFLGNQNTAETFLNPELAKIEHCVELRLKPLLKKDLS